MSALPYLITTDLQLYSLNENLKSQRAILEEAIAAVLSGSKSIKKEMGDKPTSLRSTITEIKKRVEVLVIPKDQLADFQTGVATLDEFADFDIIDYYNGLNKLSLQTYSIDAVLASIQDIKPETIQSNQQTNSDDSFDTLTIEEFANQDTSLVTEIERGYNYYTIKQGDTLQSIALDLFGDIAVAQDISQINQIYESDLIDGDYIGVTIKIPATAGGSTRSSDNLIYESLQGFTQNAIDNYLYGRDCELSQSGEIVVSESGDQRLVEGQKNVILQLTRLFSNDTGLFGTYWPNSGIALKQDENLPYLIRVEKLLNSIIEQVATDPRVSSASIDYTTLVFDRDAIRFDVLTDLIGGSQITIPVGLNI